MPLIIIFILYISLLLIKIPHILNQDQQKIYNKVAEIGNEKFTRYLAEDLERNYNLPDRREDLEYASYDRMSEDCKQITYI